MQTLSNKLTRQDKTRNDKLLEIVEEIDRLEENIRRLKIEFDIYFNGGLKIPPHKSRARIEARIMRINGDRTLSFANRYKLNAIMSRYTSFRQLWRRRLKANGDDVY